MGDVTSYATPMSTQKQGTVWLDAKHRQQVTYQWGYCQASSGRVCIVRRIRPGPTVIVIDGEENQPALLGRLVQEHLIKDSETELLLVQYPTDSNDDPLNVLGLLADGIRHWGMELTLSPAEDVMTAELSAIGALRLLREDSVSLNALMHDAGYTELVADVSTRHHADAPLSGKVVLGGPLEVWLPESAELEL